MLHLHSLVSTGKSPLPILEKSLIKDNFVYSTNLEYWLKTNSVQAENGIYTIINGKLFKDTSEINDFPCLLNFEDPFYSFTSNESLINLLKDLVNYTSSEDMRPAMTGVYFDSSENSLVATSGHILRQVYFELPKGSSFIVPATSIKKLIQIIAKMKVKNYKLEISLHYNELMPYIKFTVNEVEFISRLIDEKFPNYKSVVPLEFQSLYTFKTEQLLNNVKELKHFVNKTTKQVQVNFSSGDISAYNIDTDIRESLHFDFNVKGTIQQIKLNDFSLLMPVRLDDPLDYKVGFNRDYLEVVLKSYSSEFISMYYNKNTSAVLIAR